MAFIKCIDEGYDAEDSISNSYISNIDTPQFKLVIRSQNGNGFDFKHESFEYRGNNCFISTKGCCFIKSITFITGEDYKQQNLDLIRNEKRRLIL